MIFDLDLSRVVGDGPALVGSPQACAEEVFAEEVFTDLAVDLGARVERGWEVVGLAEEADQVRLTTASRGSPSRAPPPRCRPSSARSGSTSTRHRRAGSAHRVAGRWCGPTPYGHSRVTTYDFRAPHPDRHAPVTIDELRDEFARIHGGPVAMDSPRWLTRYTDAALQAETYRKGRVLLAGDAAHVAGRVLHNVRAQVALMNPDPRTDALRELFRELMHLDDVNAYLSGMISGTDVAYDLGEPGDVFAGTFAPDLRLKTAEAPVRLAELLRGGRAVLLDFADRAELRDTAAEWAGRVNVVSAAPEETVNAEALLVRPDGYLAYSACGKAGEAARLRASLTRWFGTP